MGGCRDKDLGSGQRPDITQPHVTMLLGYRAGFPWLMVSFNMHMPHVEEGGLSEHLLGARYTQGIDATSPVCFGGNNMCMFMVRDNTLEYTIYVGCGRLSQQ